MRAKAQAVIKECEEKNRNENGGELDYKSLAVSLEARLQETVGTYWKVAQDHVSRHLQHRVQGGGTTGVAAAAGSSGGGRQEITEKSAPAID